MRYHGKLTVWKDEQGFGFVALPGGKDDVFVHIKAFIDGDRRPAKGDILTYDLAHDQKGRARAEKIRFFLADSPRSRRLYAEKARQSPAVTARNGSFSHLLVGLFGCILVAAYFFCHLSLLIPIFYLLVSAVTFVFYADDKAAAKKRTWRTPESLLHWCSLLGGWPGALLAQQKYRHKTQKQNFKAVFWFMVIVNCSALLWLGSQSGVLFVQTIVGRFSLP